MECTEVKGDICVGEFIASVCLDSLLDYDFCFVFGMENLGDGDCWEKEKAIFEYGHTCMIRYRC